MQTWEPAPDTPVFDSPEAAALAQWASTPAAKATVVEVRPAEDDGAVWVTLQLGEVSRFQDQDIVTCMITDEGKWWAGGSTGASSG